MLNSEISEKYNRYVEAKMAKTKPWPSLFHAFWVGGLICVFGELIKDILLSAVPDMSTETAGVWESMILIFVASLFTGLGIYDRIGAYAGAGTIIPITGFSNSIASPAMEFKREGIIFGLCAKMFVIAGPVIVTGIVASIVAGIIGILL
ncbi:MAG: SpoVA/SpoVAEb family sporulation membrane protein [Clostridia bacterium]|nr:SpoVA/SpoVAEb family sporulation membrane protein [Clostridia bacterium]